MALMASHEVELVEEEITIFAEDYGTLSYENISQALNICKYCDKHFTTRSNLYKHSRRVHKEISEFQIRRTIPCIQQDCNEGFRTLASYRKHMTLKHDFICETEHLNFYTIDAFFLWLEDEEKRTSTHFILKNKPIVRKNKKSASQAKYRRYYCHRSGKYNPTGRGLRSLKSQGSSKIGFYCTSSIEVVETPKGVTVTYNKTHHGHNRLLGHLHLSLTDRTAIAVKLAKGVPKQNILHDIRRSAGSSLQRSHLTSGKDLHNIAAAFGISIPDGNLNNCNIETTSDSVEQPTPKRKRKTKKKKKDKIAIIGSGVVGSSWAMLFASAGYRVELYDNEAIKVEAALENIQHMLIRHEENGVLRGVLSSEQQFKLIKGAANLAACVKNAIHIQECISEDLELKKKVFQELDELVSNQTVLCSSSGCFPASQFASELKHKTQVIVGHPVNPPYYVPLVELIPAPWTDPIILERTRALMIEIGQKPVTLRKEIPGFALNRIQYTILNECWRLVEDGVMSVEDVDTVMSDGLGVRYAFMGPLETAYLNADGMVDYCQRYAATIHSVSQTFGAVPKMSEEMAQKIENELEKKIPFPEISNRRVWRDKKLIALAKLKSQH